MAAMKDATPAASSVTPPSKRTAVVPPSTDFESRAAAPPATDTAPTNIETPASWKYRMF